MLCGDNSFSKEWFIKDARRRFHNDKKNLAVMENTQVRFKREHKDVFVEQTAQTEQPPAKRRKEAADDNSSGFESADSTAPSPAHPAQTGPG